MIQFKNCISEGSCFQIPYMQLCLSPCNRKPRFIKWSNLQKLLILWAPWDRCQKLHFLSTWHSPPPQSASSPPAGMVSFALFLCAPPHAAFPLAGILPEPTLPITLCPSPSAAQQDQWWQEACVEFKSGDCSRPDSLPQHGRNDRPAVLILLWRCSPACAREGKVKRNRGCPRFFGLSFATCWVNHGQFHRILDSHN